MKNIIDFITTPSWWSVAISALALTLSFIAYRKTKTDVEIRFRPEPEPVVQGEIFSITKDNNQRILGYDPGIYTSIDIINAGSSDVSYFNLYAIEPYLNEKYVILTNGGIFMNEGVENVSKINVNGVSRLNLPASESGIVKAHSYQHLDILIQSPSYESKTVWLGLQFSIRKGLPERVKFFIDKKRGIHHNLLAGNFKEANFGIKIEDYAKAQKSISETMQPRVKEVMKNLREYGSPFVTRRYDDFDFVLDARFLENEVHIYFPDFLFAHLSFWPAHPHQYR